GGVVIGWTNQTGDKLHAQRLDSLGRAQWGIGRLVSTASYLFSPAAVVADGHGGTIFVWGNFDSSPDELHAQRLDSNGSPTWLQPDVPLAVAPAVPFTQPIRIAADGSGGAYFVWTDRRNGSEVYCQHLTAGGIRASGWPVNGRRVGTGSDGWVVSDGASAFIAWVDRNSP